MNYDFDDEPTITLQLALDSMNAEELRKLVALTGQKAPTRKGDMAALIVQHAEKDGSPGALANAGRRDVLLQAGVAENALLADFSGEVEVDLLVRAGLQAELVAAAAFLVTQDDAVFIALVQRAARAGLKAGRLRAVVAEAGHVEEVGVGVLACALVFVPVRTPFGLFAGGVQIDVLALAGAHHFFVVEVPAAAPFS